MYKYVKFALSLLLKHQQNGKKKKSFSMCQTCTKRFRYGWIH